MVIRLTSGTQWAYELRGAPLREFGAHYGAAHDDVTVVVAPQINLDGSEANVLGMRGNAPGASTSTATT